MNDMLPYAAQAWIPYDYRTVNSTRYAAHMSGYLAPAAGYHTAAGAVCVAPG